MLLKNWLVKHFVYVACICLLYQMHKCLLWYLISISQVKCRCSLLSIKIKIKKHSKAQWLLCGVVVFCYFILPLHYILEENIVLFTLALLLYAKSAK